MTDDDDYLDDDFYDGEDEPRFSRKKWIGGILALLIIGGFGIGIWYAYDQGVKKGVQLAPPIISADTSPVKVKPDDPGGMDIPNQDKQVFNVLKSGDAPEKVEKLMPPPEDAIKDEATETAAVSEAEKAADENKLETLIEKATKDAPTADAAASEAAEPAEKPEVMVEKIEPKVEEKKVEVAAAPVPKKVEEPKTSGPLYRVQVGSFRSPDAAEKQWSTLSAKHKSLLSGLNYRVQDVDVKDKGKYYRLQLGAYGSRDGANKLCSDLKAQKQDCLVVRG
ncbi:SPOR domain-containing protein [Sneathiella sp.]|uniref:SPOR domain-containing protein n=1 Tax=Sneathiella sp. TaxID=1964365 RepID=UPI002601AA7F|nr:SPOR domain-containing protein [Sneathiella sp.]MDF2367286.1 SPOR domain-containing protein [Sneathiella sp.]